MTDPTHLQAADELASRAGMLTDLANAERHETEYQHGYRDAHDEIVEWLRTDFEPAAQSADGPDHEAAVERMAVALRDFFHSDPVTRREAARAALAALRGKS